jgi:hypothetical protein
MRYGLLIRLATVALIVTPTSIAAQGFLGDSLAKRTLNVELGGSGGFASFNHERLVARQTYGRFGFGHWSYRTMLMNNRHYRGTIGVLGIARLFDLSWLPGEEGSWIETGLSSGIGHRSYDDASERRGGPWMVLNAEAGFRFQGPGRGLSWRMVIGPSYVMYSSLDTTRPGFGRGAAFSAGYAF